MSGCRSIWYYLGPIKNFVQVFKYKGITSSQEFIQPRLRDLLRELPLPKNGKVLITSVPSTQKRIMEYGFNQSEILAKEVAKIADIRYENTLIRNRTSVSQTKLTRKERLKNAQDQFKLAKTGFDLNGYFVIIIDDVLTTGATLSSSAHQLKQAGAKQVWGITVAKD